MPCLRRAGQCWVTDPPPNGGVHIQRRSFHRSWTVRYEQTPGHTARLKASLPRQQQVSSLWIGEEEANRDRKTTNHYPFEVFEKVSHDVVQNSGEMCWAGNTTVIVCLANVSIRQFHYSLSSILKRLKKETGAQIIRKVHKPRLVSEGWVCLSEHSLCEHCA